MKQPKITNYNDALKFLKGRNDRKYANNTVIEKFNSDIIHVKYHGHIVTIFYRSGINVYSSCGWQTVTTKERLNWFLPERFQVYQDKKIWYLSKRLATGGFNPDSKIEWKDGLTLNTNNNTYTMPKMDVNKS